VKYKLVAQNTRGKIMLEGTRHCNRNSRVKCSDETEKLERIVDCQDGIVSDPGFNV
jgi:hypothetical protein